MSASIKQLEEIIFSVNQINKSLLDDLLTLKEDKKLTNLQLNAALVAKEKAEKKYFKVKNEIEPLKKSSEDFEAKCSDLEIELSQIKYLLSVSEKSLSERVIEVKELLDKNKDLKEQGNKLENDLESLRKEMEGVMGKENDKGILEKEIKELKEKYQIIELEKSKFDKSKSEIEKKKIEAEKYAIGLEKRANELEELLSSNSTTIKQNNDTIQSLTKQNQQMKIELNDYNTLLKNEQSNREHIELESSEKIKKLQLQIDRLELSANDVPIDTLKDDSSNSGSNTITNIEYSKILKRNEELTIVNQTLDAKIDEFLKKYESEKKKRVKLEDKLIQLQNQFNISNNTTSSSSSNNSNTTSPTSPHSNKLTFSSFFSRSSTKSSIDQPPLLEVVDIDSNHSSENGNINGGSNDHSDEESNNSNSNNSNSNLESDISNINNSNSSNSSEYDEEFGKEVKNKVFRIYQDMLVECNTLLYAKQELLTDLEKGGIRKIFQITTVKSSISKIEPIQDAIKKHLHLVDSKPFLTSSEEQIEYNRVKLLQTDLDAEK